MVYNKFPTLLTIHCMHIMVKINNARDYVGEGTFCHFFTHHFNVLDATPQHQKFFNKKYIMDKIILNLTNS